MRVLQCQVNGPTDQPLRGVSVWIQTDDPDSARMRAIAALAAAGWKVARVTSNESTSADDYFRPCPSQQAFVRAQTEGIAWRFDDE